MTTIKGGQGRTPRDIGESAAVVCIAVVLAMALLVVLAVRAMGAP